MGTELVQHVVDLTELSEPGMSFDNTPQMSSHRAKRRTSRKTGTSMHVSIQPFVVDSAISAQQRTNLIIGRHKDLESA